MPDNLNARTTRLFYAAVEPERLWAVVEFRLTEKHGSRLSIAECELTTMACRFLGRHRISGLDQPESQSGAQSADGSMNQRGVE